MSVDSIADFLTIIRNGTMVAKPFVLGSYSKMRLAIAEILRQEGFVRDMQVEELEGKKVIKVYLQYIDGESVIHEIKRISKPGRRVYSNIDNIRPVIGKLGISILSTNQGVVSHLQAKKQGVGGEVLCTVW
ncbi:MAG: 30S ribosomal protein S8 [bacterium]|nr:30S ribosomal protein S8 [bacterium]